MEFKRLDKRKGSGAASIRSRYAYLIHLPDIEYFPPTDEKGVRLEGDIVLQEGRTMIPVYLTNPSQEYSYDTPGNDDEKTFLVKFVGTHPGTELEALEFSKNLLEEPFLIVIPACEKNTPGKLLGQPNNPMIFTSTHKAAKDGDKFTFSFEQRIGSEFIYFSYGGIISLPPGGDDPDIPVPPSPGFDPTKWARRDASNIDGDNVLLWREALRIYNENKLLTLGAITATTTSINLALHSSGINSVEINGNTRSKNTADHWTFPEVTEEKVFQVYAEDTPAIFGLAEDGEEIPAGALIVATLSISEAGIDIIEATSGFREKAIDKWANLMTAGGDMVLSLHHNQMRYRVSSSASDVRIGGFKNYVTDLLYSGIPLSIKNNTEGDIEFFNAVDASPLFIPIYSADLPFKIKKGETANFAWHTDNGFEIVKTGTSPDLSGYATTENLDLKLDKPLSPNNIATRVVNADNSTSDKGEFQLSEQIEIGTNTTAQASWRGKEVWVTASCTLTIPNPTTLPAFWSIDVYVIAGTLTHAITSPATWLGATPTNAPADSFYRIVRRGNTNSFKVLGL